jgi:Leucine-rich repeat (LRR) protein
MDDSKQITRRMEVAPINTVHPDCLQIILQFASDDVHNLILCCNRELNGRLHRFATDVVCGPTNRLILSRAHALPSITLLHIGPCRPSARHSSGLRFEAFTLLTKLHLEACRFHITAPVFPSSIKRLVLKNVQFGTIGKLELHHMTVLETLQIAKCVFSVASRGLPSLPNCSSTLILDQNWLGHRVRMRTRLDWFAHLTCLEVLDLGECFLPNMRSSALLTSVTKLSLTGCYDPMEGEFVSSGLRLIGSFPCIREFSTPEWHSDFTRLPSSLTSVDIGGTGSLCVDHLSALTTLILSGVCPPSPLHLPKSLTILSLDSQLTRGHNRPDAFGANFGHLTNLLELSMCNFQLNDSQATLPTGLKKLVLSLNGGMVDVDDQFYHMKNLQELLYLPAQQFGSVRPQLLSTRLTRLVLFSCVFNDLSGINLAHLTALRHLGLFDCSIFDAPSVSLPPSLVALDLSANKFATGSTMVPLDNLTSLETLTVKTCGLTSLPEKLPTSLTILEFGDNSLSAPSNGLHFLSRLTALRELRLNNCKLRDLPSLSFPLSLETLVLDDNPNLGSAPLKFDHMPALKLLRMCSCGVTSLTLPVSLEVLLLNNNPALDFVLLNLKFLIILKELHLEDCNSHSTPRLPPSITKLFLAGNELGVGRASFAYLTRLQTLQLDRKKEQDHLMELKCYS